VSLLGPRKTLLTCIFVRVEVLHARDRRTTTLQRLFSMFPNGLPGMALFLLRLVAGILLIHDGVVALPNLPELRTAIVVSIAFGAGTLLTLGLWTPVAGALVVLTEVALVLLGITDLRSSILLASVGAALAALGPGVLSIDARLYGRKRIDICNR
jgi:putative oxidoreductase